MCPDEGGLNMDMPESSLRLESRGQRAGQDLSDLDLPQRAYTRFRISRCALENYSREFERAIRDPVHQNAAALEYMRAGKDPPSYK